MPTVEIISPSVVAMTARQIGPRATTITVTTASSTSENLSGVRNSRATWPIGWASSISTSAPIMPPMAAAVIRASAAARSGRPVSSKLKKNATPKV